MSIERRNDVYAVADAVNIIEFLVGFVLVWQDMSVEMYSHSMEEKTKSLKVRSVERIGAH